MSSVLNGLGQPVGKPLPGWKGAKAPGRKQISGRYCRIEVLDASRHAESLFEANKRDSEGCIWTYLPYGPFQRFSDYANWADSASRSSDPLFHAIIDQNTDRAVGVASYLRINPGSGVIEVGHINYSPLLQQTRAATEAMFLLMGRVFDELGYRRYEWKCDALNERSRSAAERLGFTFEGVFRQATMYKGRNRDTAWYSIIDGDWPPLREAYEAWLNPANFSDGKQLKSLARFRQGTRAT